MMMLKQKNKKNLRNTANNNNNTNTTAAAANSGITTISSNLSRKTLDYKPYMIGNVGSSSSHPEKQEEEDSSATIMMKKRDTTPPHKPSSFSTTQSPSSSSSFSCRRRREVWFFAIVFGSIGFLVCQNVQQSIHLTDLSALAAPRVEDMVFLQSFVTSDTSTTKTTTTTTKRRLPYQDDTPILEYSHRFGIQYVLNHPRLSSPSSRFPNQKIAASKFNNQTIPWLPYSRRTELKPFAQNLPRVQDYYHYYHQEQQQASMVQQSLKEDDSHRPNKNNNHTKDHSWNVATFTAAAVPPPIPKDNSQKQKQTKKQKKMNVLLFYADDWTMNVLGVLNPHVLTPNIDGMAARGMVFTRNCVTTSICWISRNSLATGVYSSVHGNLKIADRAMFQHAQFDWNQTLFPLMKQQGNYFTGLIGKWHAPTPKAEMDQAFDVLKVYYGKHWLSRDNQTRHVTDLNGEDALAFLQLWNRKHRFRQPQQQSPSSSSRAQRRVDEEEERPFFLKLSFFATHARDYADPPYQPMPESMSLYEDVIIPRPKTATKQHYSDLPHFMQSAKNQGRVRNQNRFDTEANYQANIKHLYRMATEVDAVIGSVLDELKRLQAYDNTLIVFTTDNGNLHGEHGLAEKWYPYEESIRVPLVVEDPRRMAPQYRGTFNDDFTLNIDLPPTILQAAQIPVPPHMQGRDIAELYQPKKSSTRTTTPNGVTNSKELEEEKQHHRAVRGSWRQDFFYEWNTGEPKNATGHKERNGRIPAVFALIRKDYKYFYWPEENYEQLFHIEHDPYEESDVFRQNSTTTQQALYVMRQRYQFLKTWSQAGNPV